ncbi:MAG: 30S ribosomal protein S15 [Candidatus Bipolaricaulis sp.]|nr:30S ribosomal protein S15 [Candidatus Bipolaricaulis sp.]MDD5219745.1 30S ribosomal protein S15 [Candidatus Bipolaricaulis sp.]MDD5646637.1 30S ribosomal protein S15 [Candidatus Bipolaricaulis sp.]
MGLSVEKKAEIVREFGQGTGDTGSVAVQIALLTAQIQELTEHLNQHRKDFSSQRGLRRMVGQRRRMLKYIKRRDLSAYKALSERLEIRGV